MAINVFCLSINYSKENAIFVGKRQKITLKESCQLLRYGSHWYHTSSHPYLRVLWPSWLGTEGIGMGIRVPSRRLLHQFWLPLLGLSGNCPPVRFDNDLRMRKKYYEIIKRTH